MPKKNPTPPVASSTTILAREKQGKLQFYLLKRNEKSGFMAGKYVFPGGMMDPEDQNTNFWASGLNIDMTEMSKRTGGKLDPDKALAHLITAIRENFEEAGVLPGFSCDAMENGWSELKKNRLSGLPQGWLKQFVASNQPTLDLSGMSRWSHWMTPELMPRRYDTRFFMVIMPEGQRCSPDFNETTHGIWLAPKDGLAGNLDGDIPLSPPTLATLHELCGFSRINDLKTAMASRKWGAPIMPRLLVPSDGGAVILMPWDAAYAHPKEAVFAQAAQHKTLQVGEAFSRVKDDDNVWKPVAAR